MHRAEHTQPTQAMFQLVAYDRRQVYAMLRDWTPERLQGEVATGHFGKRLDREDLAELDELLTAWRQRALGVMSLRDTLLVDALRGRRVFDLICIALTSAQASVPEYLTPMLPQAPADLVALPDAAARLGKLRALERLAASQNLTLGLIEEGGAYPFPEELPELLPTQPVSNRAPVRSFEQPTGWRRRIAVLLVTAGVALLVIPLMIGAIPDHPAGVPLALLTLALLIGIKAGPTGFAGGFTIWLVANLPGFRHGSSLVEILWPAVPLMIVGVSLLAVDRRVRALWRWIRRWVAGGV